MNTRTLGLAVALGGSVLGSTVRGETRQGLVFREDFADTPPALPITQDHVVTPDLVLQLLGSGAGRLKKSYHEKARNDPHYLWSGQCPDRWAAAFEMEGTTADLSGPEARVRLRTKNFDRTLYLILRTPRGWVISETGAGASRSWTRTVLPLSSLTWSVFDPETVVRGRRTDAPELTAVSHVGVTDLKPGGASRACSRLDWIEVWERLPETPVAAVRAVDGWQVYEGDTPVLFYHTRANTWKGEYARAGYVHPLHGLNGEVLTEDFPPDHPHQRGLYWAWHQVWVGDRRAGDGWTCKNNVWDCVESRAETGTDGACVLTFAVHWKSPNWRDGEAPFVEENVEIRTLPLIAGSRRIDFTISLRARAGDVRIGGAENAKEYGGFSARLRLPEDVSFSGPAGKVRPRQGPTEALPWLTVRGRFGTAPSRVTICTHPTTPGFPQPWILRRQKSMQNPVFPGRDPVTLPLDRPLVLRYRIAVHRNDDGGPLFAEYAGDSQ